METPICDFIRSYSESDTLRLHMPGHKGLPLSGSENCTSADITEISGADSLYEASGIIRQSEDNASALFGSPTFYSCEGSSLCIHAMLYLTLLQAKSCGEQALILAGRNAHRTFLSAAALLDFDLRWLCPVTQTSYLCCSVTAQQLDDELCDIERREQRKVTAVYLTCPDYLGELPDLRTLASVCHQHGTLLLVDNAHGAYLRFLPTSQHPIDLGADMCCSSAHKTLPVLTGGAYLHISTQAPALFTAQAKAALVLFGSTSPSYLILRSLDAANKYLADGYTERLSGFIRQLDELKAALLEQEFSLYGSEPLKLTIAAKSYGYRGDELAAELRERRIEAEFSDPDFTVLMLTPEIGTDGLARLRQALCDIPQRPAISEEAPRFCAAERVLSVREACFSAMEIVPAQQSCGRILAAATVGCPPAVPIVVCGERIDANALRCFEYYGIESCAVVKE